MKRRNTRHIMLLLFIELILDKHTRIRINTRVRFCFSLLAFFSLSPPPAARDGCVRGAPRTRGSNATGSHDEIALRAICRSERYNAYTTSLRGANRPAEHTHSSMRTRDSAEQCCGSRYDMIDETYLMAEGLGS